MRPSNSASSSRVVPRLLLLGSAALLCACPSSSSNDDPLTFYSVHSTRRAVAVGTPVVFSGTHFAYLASEASGSAGGGDLNGDLDTNDSIAMVFDYIDRDETDLGVAARNLTWLGDTLFLEVREDQDGRDWDGDTEMTSDEYSLLRWTFGDVLPTYVASLDAGAEPRTLAVEGERLFLVEEGAPSGQGATTLSAIEADAPELPLPVTTTSDATNGLTPRLLGSDEGLVFVMLLESLDGDLNADTDTDDTVLALVDGTEGAMELHSTGQAIEDEDVPYRARSVGASDWLVAFLVDEAGMGTSLNDRDLFTGSWEPEGCPGVDDVDTLDQVLAYLYFADWVADAGAAPIRNTGLVGEDRVLIAGDNVATITDESDDECDLNGDGDRDDRVLRWVFAEPDPGDDLLPPGSTDLLVALAPEADIAGPSHGIVQLDERFVVLVSEEADGRNHDLDLASDFDLVAWIDPDAPTSWDFDHGLNSSFFLGATWMTEVDARDYLLIAAPEAVSGGNFNIPPGASGPDTDEDDSVPVLAFFDGDRLFPGLIPVAVRSGNAGLVLAGGNVFGRAYEVDDSRDLNDDGDTDDDVIIRYRISTGSTSVMSSLNNIGGRAVLDTDELDTTPGGGAFIADEREEGRDYNRDGDEEDLVVRYFRFD